MVMRYLAVGARCFARRSRLPRGIQLNLSTMAKVLVLFLPGKHIQPEKHGSFQSVIGVKKNVSSRH